VYGNQRPTNFICLLLKLLQIQPEKEILLEYLQAEEFKCVFRTPLRATYSTRRRYLRALAALYVRMTFRAAEVYDLLEPLLKDFRKLRVRNMGQFFHFLQFF
jgi:pre-mRNA-splicing factor 38A